MNELKVINEQVGVEDIINEFKQLCSNYIAIYDCLSKLGDDKLNKMNKAYQTLINKEFPCVYFIRNKYSNLVKIGSSKDPFRRLNELNSMCLNHFGMENALTLEGVVYVPSMKHVKYEKMLHDCYKENNKHGEWFDLSKESIENDFFPASGMINGVFVDSMCEEIMNDGFALVKFDREVDIYNIKHKLFNKTFKTNVLLRTSKEYNDMLLRICNDLNIKSIINKDIITETFCNTIVNLPISMEIYNWCLVNKTSLSAIEYFYTDDLNCGMNETCFNLNFDKRFSYDQAIDFKINEYFSKLSGGDTN